MMDEFKEVDIIKDLGMLPNGCHLYRKPNAVGGYIYYSDECGCMSIIWNTGIANESTLLAAMVAEHRRKYSEHMKSQGYNITPKSQFDKKVIRGGSPKSTKRLRPKCPECGKSSNKHPHDDCDIVLGKRSWRQLGVYDG